MDDSIIKELIQKKRISKEDTIDYIKARIQDLDEQSEKTSIGYNMENSTYSKFIGRNVKVKMSADIFSESEHCIIDDSLEESLSIARQCLKESFMVFDSDERIPNLIYSSITDRGVSISLINELMRTTLIDRGKNFEDEIERSKIFLSNALNGKHTSYSEIKEKHLCQCLELAILLHNTYQILGYNSQILFGMIDSNESLGIHTFNILDLSQTNAARLLIDLSNPYFIDENGELKIGIPVAVLTNQEYNELINGKKIYKDMAEFLNHAFHSNLKPRYCSYGLRINQYDKKKMQDFHTKKYQNYLIVNKKDMTREGIEVWIKSIIKRNI